MLRRLFAAVLTLASLGLAIQAQPRPLKVVATHSILGDFVQNVGGEAIQLTVLVGRDEDSHVYEPSPQDVIALAEADLIFENGLELETWLDDLYEASASQARRVAVSEGIEAIPYMGHEDHDHEHEGEADDHDHDHKAEATAEAHDHSHDHGHEHGEYDPHTWLSPLSARAMVANIRDALSEADPTNAEAYAANAEAYMAELDALDAYIRQQVEAISQEHRVLVTTHEALSYFARDYGFSLLSLTGTISTEGADPSAGALAEVIEDIRASGAVAIFAENVANASTLELVAQELGLQVVGPLYTDALSQEDGPGATYLSMMRYNIELIAEALR